MSTKNKLRWNEFVQGQWDEYDALPPKAKQMVKDAFFIGAAKTFKCITDKSVGEGLPNHIRYMKELTDEINEHLLQRLSEQSGLDDYLKEMFHG